MFSFQACAVIEMVNAKASTRNHAQAHVSRIEINLRDSKCLQRLRVFYCASEINGHITPNQLGGERVRGHEMAQLRVYSSVSSRRKTKREKIPKVRMWRVATRMHCIGSHSAYTRQVECWCIMMIFIVEKGGACSLKWVRLFVLFLVIGAIMRAPV